MKSKGEILLVDDEADLRELVSAALSQAGYKVSAACDGAEGVALAGTGKFDLIILDMVMPGMDGLTALRELKKAAPGTEVVMLTGHGSVETAVESMRRGAFDYIKKPFKLAELRAVAAKVVEKRRLDAIAGAAFSSLSREALLALALDSAASILGGEEVLLALPGSGAAPGFFAFLGAEERRMFGPEFCARGLALLEEAGGAALALSPEADARFLDFPPAWETAASLLIPLEEDGKPTGLLCVNRAVGGPAFSEEELRLARKLGPAVSAALKTLALTEQLRAARLQLVKTQKMESLGRLTGRVSHDFNNLLFVIIGSMQLLMERQAPGDGLKLSAEILRMAREAEALIKQLLLFSRGEEVPAQPTDLNAATEEIKMILEKLPGKAIRTVYQPAPDLPKVRIRPDKFKQVAFNLVKNARDAMPGGGEVTIRTRRAEAGDEVPESLKGGFAVLEVSDTGPGISQENAKKIFEPFFTTKPAGKGTGLGLHIVQCIVSECAGKIDVVSRAGQGALFRVFLPAA